MTLLTDREAQGTTSTRDVANATPWEVRMTDVKAWAAALDKHVERGLIEDNEVWFSITAGSATQEQVDGKPGPGGHRDEPYFASRYVEASYTARGKLHKLSVYCGVSWKYEPSNDEARAFMAARVQECAQNVQEAVRAVSVALSRHPHLEVNSGASLHLHAIEDGPWVAYPGTRIDAPVTDTRCGVCDALLHQVRGTWRDESGLDCLMVDNGLDHNRRPKKKLDHYHRPAGVLL